MAFRLAMLPFKSELVSCHCFAVMPNIATFSTSTSLTFILKSLFFRIYSTIGLKSDGLYLYVHTQEETCIIEKLARELSARRDGSDRTNPPPVLRYGYVFYEPA